MSLLEKLRQTINLLNITHALIILSVKGEKLSIISIPKNLSILKMQTNMDRVISIKRRWF